ncbi:MAG: hypothetical protein MK165_05990 [Pirellulaceae bacterium]|nr:hypothetical protein [Pirellulaceae bacterium]
MGQKFAGVLGTLAFVATLVRELIEGAAAEASLILSTFCLLGFAAIGWFVGTIAEWIIVESVLTRFHHELKTIPPTKQSR